MIKSAELKYFKDHKLILIFIGFLFFFNNFLMPHGLSINLLLTPIYFFYILKDERNKFLNIFLFFLFYLLVHVSLGIENFANYNKTSILIVSAVIFVLAAFKFLKKINLDFVFKFLTLINFAFFLISVVALKVAYVKEILWSFKPISNGIEALPRLQMFTPEPSHYALLIIPLVIYFILKLIIEGFKKETIFYLSIVLIPFFIGLSFGAIFILIFSLILVNIIYPKKLMFSARNWKFTLLSIIGFFSLAIGVHVLKPNNPISKRVSMIISGEDTSANGRTTQSFSLASDVAKDKSFLFGVGPGQSKIIAKKYYFKNLPYRSAMPEVIRYSNVTATTLASYGLLGLVLRISFLIFVFFKFKVYKNIFAMSIFTFMFVFQFMASYMINMSELIIWVTAVLSFSKPEFKWANA